MIPVSRTAQFAKVHKILKKSYKSVEPDAKRSVLDHLLFACCLEDAHYEVAEEAFATVVHTFFDWNEVRVTSIAELSEVMAALPDARAAANRLKRVLHSVFEATYAFDLEDQRKKNLGPTIKWLEKLDGTTPFSVAYVVQAALGGHAIPVDTGTMQMLRLLDLVTEKDAAANVVPGIERAVAKSKGFEFGSMLHQFGADFTANPCTLAVREILLQINPEIKDRLPKRRSDKPTKAAPDEASKGRAAASATQTPAAEGQEPAKRGKKKVEETKEPGESQAAAAKEDALQLGKKKPATGKKPAAAEEVPGTAKDNPEPFRKKSASAALAKRKPR
jgi:endonuclease III